MRHVTLVLVPTKYKLQVFSNHTTGSEEHLVFEEITEDPFQLLYEMKRKTFDNTTDVDFRRSEIRACFKHHHNYGGEFRIKIERTK